MREERDLFLHYLAGDETQEGRRTRALFEVLCDIRAELIKLNESKITHLNLGDGVTSDTISQVVKTFCEKK